VFLRRIYKTLFRKYRFHWYSKHEIRDKKWVFIRRYLSYCR